MQDRYTGDIGDYGKLGLLRSLAAAGLHVGVNWYRTPDEDHNEDGKFTQYLTPRSVPEDSGRKCMDMKTQFFTIDSVPAVLYGEESDKGWLFVHGQRGHKEEGEAFAQIVCPKGFQVLAVDLPGHGARKAEGAELTPWAVVPELQAAAGWAKQRWRSVSVRANSIGAYFSLLALDTPDKALFVSPILDMEELIRTMMTWAGVREDQLREAGEIATHFGQTLSWQYLCYVRQHPIHDWQSQTCILYGGKDAMTPRSTVEAYAQRHRAALTLVPDAEHWFHTPAQLADLQAWESKNT